MTPPATPAELLPPIVGVVASADSLEACKALLDGLPADSRLAFVLLQPYDGPHAALPIALLAARARLPVVEVRGGERVAPQQVYVVAPDHQLRIEAGELQVYCPAAPARASIDAALRSLADDQRERAMAVLLAGAGGHGSLGLRAIRAAGGLALVQAGSGADAPRPTAAALADAVLPVEQMPEVLLRHARHLDSGAAAEPADALAQVVALLRARAKADFRLYRKTMLMRRVQRRMDLLRVSALPDYIQRLRERPEEVKALARDLLISVTSFFRDAEMYDVLEAQVIPELLRAKGPDAPVRVWVAGCATGEEAYTLALLLQEQMAAAQMTGPLQVFASDVDADAVEVARRGIYPDAIAADLSAERQARFFVRAGDATLQVSKALRDSVLFTTQNVLTDAPFSRLDLVSCRNLLIYLEPEVQEKVLAMLHFALVDGGVLLLGPSESIGRQQALYTPLSKKWRIFRRIGTRSERVAFPIAAPHPPARGAEPRTPSWAELTRALLLEDYAPAAVLVSRDFEVLHYSGATEHYLRQPPGAPTQDLSALAREGLSGRLRAAMHKALRSGERVQLPGGSIERRGSEVAVRISARPVRPPGAGEPLLLITFEEDLARGSAAPPLPGSGGEATSLQQLEHELKSSREALQSTIEELESSNEQLKAANEEMTAMNEELQSANEELETSKEELQSINEEVSAVNAQLQDKVEQLEATSNDIANLLTSADVATLFLGSDRRIRRYTPAATRLFNLIATDIGRPLDDIRPLFTDPQLHADVAQVLDTLGTREAEVPAHDGRWYIRRVAPYRTADHRVDGAVLAFADVSPTKLAEQELRRLSAELEQRVEQRTAELRGSVAELRRAQDELIDERRFVNAVFDTAGLLIAALDRDGRIVRCNQAYQEFVGASGEALAGTRFSDALGWPEERTACRAWLDELAGGRRPPAWEQVAAQPDGALRRVSWHGNRLLGADGTVEFLIAAGLEVTEQRRIEEEARQRRAEVAYLQRVSTAGEMAATLAHELNQPLAAMSAFADAALGRLHAQGGAAPETVEDLEQIGEQARRAAQAVAELRRFLARGEPSRPQPQDLNALVRSAHELMLADARARQVHVRLDLADGLAPVLAEAVHIEHVLTNLVVNAIDAARTAPLHERGEVLIRTRAASATMAQVTVRDSGLGIAAAEVERIFETFYTTKAGGLGMGLPISRSIVEAHGGKLWAEPGTEGGTLHFTLPFADATHGVPG